MTVSAAPHAGMRGFWLSYRLRWKRRYFLARAFRRRRQLTLLNDRTNQIAPDDVLAFSTMRNEMLRLPHFLKHHRAMGVGHFLIVDNFSDDGTAEYLRDQPDVSLWQTQASYKAARFGVDWLTWLQFRFGHGHWSLTLDADEIFCFPHDDKADLGDLTKWLTSRGIEAVSAVMVELFPKGPIGAADQDPMAPLGSLRWYDGDNFWAEPRADGLGQVLRGGVRARNFFASEPKRAPTMNKVPLIKWNRRYAYVSSTHVVLPAALNVDHFAKDAAPTAVLLHTKFMADAPERARIEKIRGEHFSVGSLYGDYYDGVAQSPDFWHGGAREFTGWKGLQEAGLSHVGDWAPPENGPN